MLAGSHTTQKWDRCSYVCGV